MKTVFRLTFLLLVLAGCNKSTVQKPVWVNPQAILSVPIDSLVFQSASKNWNAVLLSFTQPIPLTVLPLENGFRLKQATGYGGTEGPARLVLSCNGQSFYYPVFLRNKTFSQIDEKDYRSPKTVNVDSSLQQQRLVHSIDAWRNLVYTLNTSLYFLEDSIVLQPRAGVFRAQKEKALSSFYVQPGSPLSVPVRATFLVAPEVFRVTAGPLQDAYNNVVTDGMQVVFLYTDSINHYRMEAATQNGMATVWVPATNGQSFALKAMVHQTVSPTLQLKR